MHFESKNYHKNDEIDEDKSSLNNLNSTIPLQKV